MTRWLLIAIVGLLALVVSPFYGCGSTFRYGAGDIRAAVEGVWVLEVPATAASEAREITFSIAQGGRETQRSERPGPVRSAAACSHQTWVRSAEACLDFSTMPLDVELIAGMTTAVKPSGSFEVMGLTFEAGKLRLTLGESNVEAMLSPNGEARTVRIDRNAADDGATLTRISR